MKNVEPRFARAALIDSCVPIFPRLHGSRCLFVFSASAIGPNNTVSVWQAGLDINSFPGGTLGERIANAAASIGATILSPAATDNATPVPDPTQPGYLAFTTKAMIDQSHKLGIPVIPWTVSHQVAHVSLC